MNTCIRICGRRSSQGWYTDVPWIRSEIPTSQQAIQVRPGARILTVRALHVSTLGGSPKVSFYLGSSARHRRAAPCLSVRSVAKQNGDWRWHFYEAVFATATIADCLAASSSANFSLLILRWWHFARAALTVSAHQ